MKVSGFFRLSGVYAFLAEGLPILAGSHSLLLFEETHKIFFIRKAAGVGNGGYREELSLTEKVFCGCQTYMIYISIDRIAGVFFHQGSEVGRMVVKAGGQFLYSNRLIIVAAEPFDHIQKFSGRPIFQEAVQREHF